MNVDQDLIQLVGLARLADTAVPPVNSLGADVLLKAAEFANERLNVRLPDPERDEKDDPEAVRATTNDDAVMEFARTIGWQVADVVEGCPPSAQRTPETDREGRRRLWHAWADLGMFAHDPPATNLIFTYIEEAATQVAEAVLMAGRDAMRREGP